MRKLMAQITTRSMMTKEYDSAKSALALTVRTIGQSSILFMWNTVSELTQVFV